MKKRWYDFLWIASLLYLVLGFFNILFAWLGLLCFFIPLVIAFAGGDKGYCNRFCGRGQLFSLLGGRFGLSRRADIPRVDEKQGVPLRVFGLFSADVLPDALEHISGSLPGAAGAAPGRHSALDVPAALALGLLWNPLFPRRGQFAFGFYSVMLTSTVLGWSQWCFSNPAHGVCIALWAP